MRQLRRALAPASPRGASPARSGGTFRTGPLPRDAVEDDRPLPRGPDRGGHGRPRPAGPLLHRGLQRRRLPDDRLWPDLGPDLRRPADAVGRVDRRRPVRPERPLRRKRRGAAAPGPLGRRRHLPLEGRRTDVDTPRPPRRPADPRDLRRSSGRENAPRRGARAPVRRQRGAGRLPLDRRRGDLQEGPVPRREHRRHRTRSRPVEPRRRLRCALGVPSGAVGKRRLHRARERPSQVGRWRQELAEDREGPPDVRAGARPDRHDGRAGGAEAALRRRRGGRGAQRALPVRRRRRELAPRQRRGAGQRAGVRLRRGEGRPAKRRRRLGREHVHSTVRATAGRPSPPSRGRREGTTTTRSGSTPPIRR